MPQTGFPAQEAAGGCSPGTQAIEHMRRGRALRGIQVAALLYQVHDARLAGLARHERRQLLSHLIGLWNSPGDHLPQQDPQAEDVDLHHQAPHLSPRCSWGSQRMHHGPPASAAPSLHDSQPAPQAGQPLAHLLRLQNSGCHSLPKQGAQGEDLILQHGSHGFDCNEFWEQKTQMVQHCWTGATVSPAAHSSGQGVQAAFPLQRGAWRRVFLRDSRTTRLSLWTLIGGAGQSAA